MQPSGILASQVIHLCFWAMFSRVSPPLVLSFLRGGGMEEEEQGMENVLVFLLFSLQLAHECYLHHDKEVMCNATQAGS